VSIDRAHRTDGATWWATETITDNDVETLVDRAGASGVDVLLTHDAPALPPSISPLGDPVIDADCAPSVGEIARATELLAPRLLLHGHYHVRYSGQHGMARVEGLAADEQAGKFGSSWCALELPTLTVLGAAELAG